MAPCEEDERAVFLGINRSQPITKKCNIINSLNSNFRISIVVYCVALLPFLRDFVPYLSHDNFKKNSKAKAGHQSQKYRKGQKGRAPLKI
jgi:hypothetical protein